MPSSPPPLRLLERPAQRLPRGGRQATPPATKGWWQRWLGRMESLTR